MKVLLDTHTLIWYYQTDAKMSAKALSAIQDSSNDVLVSPASYWEIAIKLCLQKPVLQVPFGTFVQEAIYDNGFQILPIEPQHAAIVATLTAHRLSQNT